MGIENEEREALKQEIKVNRDKVARLGVDIQDALYDLGRHLANLRIDGGFAEIGDLIERADNLRASLKEIDREIADAGQLADDYRLFRQDLDQTRRDIKVMSARVERQISTLGEGAFEVHQKGKVPARYAAFFTEVLGKDGSGVESPDPGTGAGNEAQEGFLGRLRSLRKRLDLRGGGDRRTNDPRKSRYPRLGWRLLKTDFFEDRKTDGALRELFHEVRKNLVQVMELERHQKHRVEGLAAFDREMKGEWGFPDIESMRRELERQRSEMLSSVDALYGNIGTLFNDHRLHNYVDDSFVAASRRRVKRFHVRVNQLKLRQKEILLALKNENPVDDTPSTTD